MELFFRKFMDTSVAPIGLLTLGQCNFANYASRTKCMKCDALAPGTFCKPGPFYPCILLMALK